MLSIPLWTGQYGICVFPLDLVMQGLTEALPYDNVYE